MEHDPPERPLYEERQRAPHDPAQDEQGGEIEGSGMSRPDTERPPDPQEAEVQELPAAPSAGRRSSVPRRKPSASGRRAVRKPPKRQGRKTLSRKSARKPAAARKRGKSARGTRAKTPGTRRVKARRR
jgi:hypothetical protein